MNEATEATVTEEEIIDENDAKDATDANFAILNTSELLSYVTEHQLEKMI